MNLVDPFGRFGRFGPWCLLCLCHQLRLECLGDLVGQWSPLCLFGQLYQLSRCFLGSLWDPFGLFGRWRLCYLVGLWRQSIRLSLETLVGQLRPWCQFGQLYLWSLEVL